MKTFSQAEGYKPHSAIAFKSIPLKMSVEELKEHISAAGYEIVSEITSSKKHSLVIRRTDNG